MPRLTKERAKQRLQAVLDTIPSLQTEGGPTEFKKWQRDTKIAIINIFGETSFHVKEFERINYIPLIIAGNTTDSDFQQAQLRGLKTATGLIESMISEVDEYWDTGDKETTSPDGLASSNRPTTTRVFLIHGRDHGTRDTVTRFLASLGLEPIVLAEQPDDGRTIIEKFEQYTQGDFAVALFTPDDVGGLGEDSLQSRARQNVVFEFGYCIGKFGRDRLRAVVKGNIEIPSDYSGVLYIPMDDSDGWKMNLIRELKSAGFDIDANRAFSNH